MNIDYTQQNQALITDHTSSSTSSIPVHTDTPADSPDSPSIPSSALSSFQASPLHHSANLALIQQQQQPSHSLASLSISSPTTILQPSNINPASDSTHSNLCSPISPLNQHLPTGHLQNRSIPPPLCLAPTISKLQALRPSSLSSSDDLMTARGSQFPIDAIEPPRHLANPAPGAATLANSCRRFQPYLSPSLQSNSNNESLSNNNWSNELNKSLPSNSARALFLPSNNNNFRSAPDDASLSSNDLRSSCSSLASTASSQSSGYFPPSSNNLSFDDPSSSGATCGSAGGGGAETLYPPLAAAGFSQAAAYPAYTGPTQRPSLAGGLPYPTTSFNPSGGSPPIASTSSSYFPFDSAGAGRRHTVSAFASPMPIELNLMGHTDMDENSIKEEKRRRNKESSQRFRDRTRERQREKQERLEYLERYTKQLENELRPYRAGNSMQDCAQDSSGAQATNRARSQEHDLIARLQAENEQLRRSLKGMREELDQLQHLAGNQSPHSPSSMGHMYSNTLAQLSPPASTDFAPGSQASSPAAEPSYFSPTSAAEAPYFSPAARGASPSSDSALPNQQSLGQSSSSTVPPFPASNDHISHLHQLAGFNQQLSQQQLSSTNEFWDANASSKASGWQASKPHQQPSTQ